MHVSSSGYRGIYIDFDGIRHGYVVDGRFEESRIDFDDFIITPTLFNSHTHLGDSIAKDPPFMELTTMVGPNGYKFKILSSHSIEELRNALINEIEIAKDSGTRVFLDFRESGIEGLKVVENIDCVIPLGRPRNIEEAEKIICSGFAMSSVRDHELDFLFLLRKIAKSRGIVFAIHAGEMNCNDVEKAIELNPDLVVHMNSCPELLGSFMDADIPVVSCIRSNTFFNLMNPKTYKILSSYDKWLLGTDNAMLFNPSMLDEMHFSSLIVKDDWAIFRASINGYRIFEDRFGIRSGYIVFHREKNFKNAKNLISTLVRRANAMDIEVILV